MKNFRKKLCCLLLAFATLVSIFPNIPNFTIKAEAAPLVYLNVKDLPKNALDSFLKAVTSEDTKKVYPLVKYNGSYCVHIGYYQNGRRTECYLKESAFKTAKTTLANTKNISYFRKANVYLSNGWKDSNYNDDLYACSQYFLGDNQFKFKIMQVEQSAFRNSGSFLCVKAKVTRNVDFTYDASTHLLHIRSKEISGIGMDTKYQVQVSSKRSQYLTSMKCDAKITDRNSAEIDFAGKINIMGKLYGYFTGDIVSLTCDAVQCASDWINYEKYYTDRYESETIDLNRASQKVDNNSIYRCNTVCPKPLYKTGDYCEYQIGLSETINKSYDTFYITPIYSASALNYN